jgi:hypothetical protein
MEVKRDFSELADAWGSPVVAREAVSKFSGGLLNPRTMANIDSLGSGPKMVKLGRKRGYWVDSLIEWMNSRMDEGE